MKLTPLEKAEELVDSFIEKMFLLRDGYNSSEILDAAKQCALIAVDEILNGSRLFYFEDYKYWNEVKQEILNLK